MPSLGTHDDRLDVVISFHEMGSWINQRGSREGGAGQADQIAVPSLSGICLREYSLGCNVRAPATGDPQRDQ